MAKKVNCPDCGGKAVAIVYGFPGDSLFKKAERGEVKLGGCVVMPSNPAFHCPKCNKDFGSIRDEFNWDW